MLMQVPDKSDAEAGTWHDRESTIAIVNVTPVDDPSMRKGNLYTGSFISEEKAPGNSKNNPLI